MYRYSYLIADLSLLVLWLLLFFYRKDVRREMLVISTMFGIAGLLSEPIYTSDWWHPLTITNTRIGIEDFLFGFWIGGVAAVIYEEVFKRRLRPRKAAPKDNARFLRVSIIFSLALAILFFSAFFIFKLNSFYSSLIAFIPLTLLIWIWRKDLIADSFFSGLLISVIGLLWFWIPELLTPGWINTHWYFKTLSGIVILKAPLEDLIWGFSAEAYIGPLYEFWQKDRLTKKIT